MPPMRETPASSAHDRFLQTRYREVTLSSVLFGVIFGAVMNSAAERQSRSV